MSARTFGRDGYFTTGDLAGMIGCSLRQAIRIVDRGIVKGHRIPGSRRRRISAASVFNALTQHGIPIPPELAALLEIEPPATPAVLYVAAASDTVGRFVASVQAVRPNVIWASGSLIDIAFRCAEQWPDAVLLGTDEGLTPAVIAARTLLAHEKPPVVAMMLDDASDASDSRLDGVRGRLSWLGRNPGSWMDVITMSLLPRMRTDGTTTEDARTATLRAC